MVAGDLKSFRIELQTILNETSMVKPLTSKYHHHWLPLMEEDLDTIDLNQKLNVELTYCGKKLCCRPWFMNQCLEQDH